MVKTAYLTSLLSKDKPKVIAAGVGEHGPVDPTRYWYESAWCIHLYRYNARLVADGVPYDLYDGAITIIPPGVAFTFEFTRASSRHLFAIFELPTVGRLGTPHVVDARISFDDLWNRFMDGIRRQGANQVRRDVRLWDVFLEVADLASGPADRGHPLVAKARELIEVELQAGIRSIDVAAELGMSNGHINVLFKDQLGKSVAAYIRSRKVTIVSELLHGSEMPIKAIAGRIGMSDLQQFNKFVRRELGYAPRELRGGLTT